MEIRPWYERWPERLEFELQALDANGLRYIVDQAARESGLIKLQVYLDHAGEELQLEATFPDLYPYFRFDVRAPSLTLERHQSVFGKGLCLIGRDTGLWNTTDTLASFIKERVPLAIRVGSAVDPAEVVGLEEPHAEPLADTYHHAFVPQSIVLFDGSWSVDPSVQRGDLVVGFEADAVPQIRGWVLQVRDESRRVLNGSPPEVCSRHTQKLVIPWVRMPSPPRTDEGRSFWKAVTRLDPRAEQLSWKPAAGEYKVRGLAVLCEEEIAYRRKGDGFIFAFSLLPPEKSRQPVVYFLVRPGRAGRQDMIARIPELRPLADKVVTVFGLGCLGSPSALEFARAHVGDLRLVDGDVVEPGTIVRWAFGMPASGWWKSKVLHDHIRHHYPYTRVSWEHHGLGAARDEPGQPSELELVSRMVSGSSLIYDSTAELGVQHYLSDLACEHGLPYVRVEGTQGGWGGLVARIVPGKTRGCFHCLQQSLLDGTIQAPPFDPAGEVQPAGCGDPTFTGANFDLGMVALTGVRTAVSTLCSSEDGYPDSDWDVAVISLRSVEGNPIPPRWDTYRLVTNPSCASCSRK